MSMNITRQDLRSLETYHQGREQYLQKMIEYKNDRRVKLGEHISLLFENRDTVLFQIQELANSEDLTDPNELDEYIDIYSGMLPDDNELSGTLFIELDNQKLLEEVLTKLKGIEHHLSLVVGDETIQAVFEEEHDDRDVTTSVHYLKFPLTQSAKSYIMNGTADSIEMRLVLNHLNQSTEVKLSIDTIRSLQNDLRGKTSEFLH